MAVIDNRDVDPELWPLVEGFPPIDVTAETLPGFRAAMTEMSALPDPATHPDVLIETVMKPVHCLVYRPATVAPRSALLHIHGGGFVMGSPEMDAARNIALVRALACTIVSVDYRLAPEHPHPAGLEDCHAALEWLATQLAHWGISPERVGVIGESAGGGLAAALALLARDRRSVRLACQVLIYPMLVPPSESLDTTSPDRRTGRYIWTRASNSWCWSAAHPDGPDRIRLPALAPDLAGLPPAFVAVGELDLFVHDDLALVRRLLAAGVSVEAHVYPGAIHGFDRMVDAAVSRRHARDLTDFLRRHLG